MRNHPASKRRRTINAAQTRCRRVPTIVGVSVVASPWKKKNFNPSVSSPPPSYPPRPAPSQWDRPRRRIRAPAPTRRGATRRLQWRTTRPPPATSWQFPWRSRRDATTGVPALANTPHVWQQVRTPHRRDARTGCARSATTINPRRTLFSRCRASPRASGAAGRRR